MLKNLFTFIHRRDVRFGKRQRESERIKKKNFAALAIEKFSKLTQPRKKTLRRKKSHNKAKINVTVNKAFDNNSRVINENSL